MSQLRQSELFAGQDWTAIYKAFTEVNLNAYDFDTIRQSMKEYIERNYPEDFNDWIESSEFVAIMDLLAYLGQSLAFRMDLNARENFLEIARSRESILRLARFLSYSPKRNYTSNGLVKLTEIRATQDIIDSAGNNLNNVVIRWDDPNNPNWFEQFILVLNATLINTNQFGSPLKSMSINGIQTSLYRVESIPIGAGNLPFTTSVGGSTYNFDIVNVDFNENRGFFEQSPNPQAPFHIIYRNDGNGNSSPDTGFFLMFKQGSLSRADFLIEDPIENRVIDVDIQNINETDVWLQTVNDNGSVDHEWTRVGYVPTDDVSKIIVPIENITYNSLPNSVQNIYQVITRINDQISLRFGDGRFGNIPLGNLRVWYRQSAGISMTIRPEEMRNITVSMPYLGLDGKSHNMFMTFSLQETVINSAPAESNSDIKRRVGAVYATQGRMVSGSDYNSLPAANNLALKVKAVNRVYSGHSRFIDLNDPTGTYQNANVFSDDGCLFVEQNNQYEEIPIQSTFSTQSLIFDTILPMVRSVEMRDFLHQTWLNNAGSGQFNFIFGGVPVRWQQSTNAIYTSTGRFVRVDPLPNDPEAWDQYAMVLGPHAGEFAVEKHIMPGAMIKFRRAGWVTVSSIEGTGDSFLTGQEGPVRLNEAVKTGDTAIQVIPSVRRTLTTSELELLAEKINDRRSFGIGWDFVNQTWYFIDTANLNQTSPYDYGSKGTAADSSWLIKCEYTTLNWRITGRGIRYIFESENDVRFFFVNKFKAIDPNTGRASSDFINILQTNSNPRSMAASSWMPRTKYNIGDVVSVEEVVNGTLTTNFYECAMAHTSGDHFMAVTAGVDLTGDKPVGVLMEYWRITTAGLSSDIKWTLESTYTYDDGYQEPRRVRVSFIDTDLDGQPDNPESFSELAHTGEWIFHERVRDLYGYEHYRINRNIKVFEMGSELSVLQPGEVIFVHDATNTTGEFYRYMLPTPGIPLWGRIQEIAPVTDPGAYMANKGRRGLKFQWRHYAPVDHRIDPAINNIIDVFVLTREYHTMMQNWYRKGMNVNSLPKPPSELQLRMAYSDLEQYKMFSDQISWRPVKYKLLFGVGAEPELKAKFKIVKLHGTTISDGEIKSRVIQAVQDFFDVNSWDFGETFYYTELASFIHTRLVNAISSVVIVPLKDSQSFGELFEVRCNPDEMFFPTANVNDIEIIPTNTQTSLRIR